VPSSVKPETIRKRVRRNNVTGVSASRTSPVASIEPLIMVYCLCLARIGQPLVQDQLCSLAISIITGTPLEQQVINWKQLHSTYDHSKPLLGVSWYKGFMNRNNDVLMAEHARTQDVNRIEWTTYKNVAASYTSIYGKMVEAGVAKKLDEHVWLLLHSALQKTKPPNL
jgi:hypothetical protein